MLYTYQLKLNSGEIIETKMELKIPRFGRFEYSNLAFQVINIDEFEVVFCREIHLLDFEHNYSVNMEQLLFQDRVIDFLKKRGYPVTPDELTEDKFQEIILELLAPYFTVEQEVWGTHFSGRRMKIDAIVTPKNTSEWRNKNIKFGIEFKKPLSTELNNRRETDVLVEIPMKLTRVFLFK
ncbi:hypothetical protein [Aquimarina algiphila]|uniref:hypothetical protein n=1 Tax=Aquimarina algiphila TaxID=2047982 RepID=UPI00232AD22E|nr:hypothetical protein [Aquimarina algiphila]